MHAPRNSPNRIPGFFFEKEAWPRSRDPVNFGTLSANSSKMVKATDFKFVPVPIRYLEKIEYSESCGHVTDDVT